MFNYEIIINFLTFIYIIIKLLRITVFTKIILEFLPMFNLFNWPVSAIYFISAPIMNFFQYYIPSIKIGIIELDFYLIIIFNLFNIIINFLEHIINYYN